ncbi:flagellar hook-length control protein FliK [Pseudomonas defluvii]|uniref:flagellar hook-length control protein FliK n=1 Tax=Pseudomonas defluvii TaxID=1876757 RepID=UPI00390581D0
MPVATNPLLQSGSVANSSRASGASSDKSQQALGDKASGFSQVLSQSKDKVAGGPFFDKPVAPANTASSGNTKVDGQQKVAGSGKSLPADSASKKDVQSQDDAQVADTAPAQDAVAADDSVNQADPQLLDPSLVAGQVTDAQPGAQLIQAQAEAVAPVVQAAQLQAQVQAPVSEEPPFDPDVDPLADLPTLRLALEQSAQAQGTTSVNATPTGKSAQSQPEATPGQSAVNTLTAIVDKPGAEAEQGEPGEKAFGALMDDGLKDLKGAASDTRVDNFAERLSALTQAATAKTANAVPVPAAPLNQPLAMNQSGWTEGLVNRVMYLSSQNLKSADIQLQPAELGRLDIRVNLAADQPAQITFVSGHVVVRDALEGQVHRLRELFAQQGLAQPDVNVSDQSRGQQQGAQEGPRLSGVAGRRGEAGDAAEQAEADAGVKAVERQVVIGSSAVDYYA